jgi:hypothetical protein
VTEKVLKRRGGLGEITWEVGREGGVPVKRIGAAAPGSGGDGAAVREEEREGVRET